MECNFYNKKYIKEFEIRKEIVSLYKSFLIILEDLHNDHFENFQQLKNNLKEHSAIINQADYFSEQKASYLRKKVLDKGNDCIRNLIGE